MAAKTKEPAAPKAKKAKSASQRAKTEANIKAAAARLVALQAKQRLVNELRKQGIVGSDATILKVIGERDRKVETDKAREWVATVLAGPHGERVKRFIGNGLAGEPTRVAMIVRNYLHTQGLPLNGG